MEHMDGSVSESLMDMGHHFQPGPRWMEEGYWYGYAVNKDELIRPF